MFIAYAIGAAYSSYKADKFREEKRKLLKDFGITLTESEMETLNRLVIPRQIEEFIREIFRNRLG